jgi:multidrug efflux system membrane fusion protein
VTQEVTEYVDFTGRTAAKDSVDVRARVSGYIVDAPFTEGAEVARDTLL